MVPQRMDARTLLRSTFLGRKWDRGLLEGMKPGNSSLLISSFKMQQFGFWVPEEAKAALQQRLAVSGQILACAVFLDKGETMRCPLVLQTAAPCESWKCRQKRTCLADSQKKARKFWIQSLLKINIQLRPRVFLLGLMDKQFVWKLNVIDSGKNQKVLHLIDRDGAFNLFGFQIPYGANLITARTAIKTQTVNSTQLNEHNIFCLSKKPYYGLHNKVVHAILR